MRSVLVGLVLVVSSLAQAQPRVVDRLVALVDGKPILRSAVLERVQTQAPKDATAEQKKQLEAAAFEELIDDALIEQDADAMKVELSTEEIDRALTEIASSNQITVEQLSAEVVKQGLTVPRYRQMLRQQLLHMRWLRYKVADAQVKANPSNVGEFYDAEKKKILTTLRAKASIEVRP